MADRSQQTPLGPGVVDRGAYNYGGDPNAADRESGALSAEAAAAQRRQGEQINTGNADQDRGNAYASRSSQLGMADLMRARAMGQVPSIAQMQGDRQMGQAAAEQSSAAASARGPAALALAQQGAAANTAAMQSNISNSTQINAANERMQAEQAAAGQYANLRGGDMSQQGQDFSQSAAQAQMNAQQRAQNDQYAMGTRQQGIGIQGMQLSADMNRDAAEQAGHFNAAGLQEQKNAAHDSSVMGFVNAGIQGAAAVGSTAAMLSDEDAKVPVTWGGGGSQEPAAAPSTWGTGRGTSAVDMARMLAHQALDQHASREATSRAGVAGGPQAFDANPGRRWDSEELGLIQAKQRNGVELTEKEEASQASLRHRSAGRDEAPKATKPDAKAETAVAAAKGDTAGAAFGDKLKSGLSGIGNALSAGARHPDTGFRYVPAAQHQLAVPQMTSDEAAKVAADDAPAAAPSGGSKPGGGMKGAMSSLKGVGAALMAGAAGSGTQFHYTPPEHHDLDTTVSDERTKVAKDWTFSDVDNTVGVHYLGKEKPGEQMHADGVHGDKEDAEGRKQISASLSGRTPHFTVGTGSNESAGYGEGQESGGSGHEDSGKPKPKPQVSMAARLAPKPRKYTDAELNRIAAEMLGAQKVQNDAQLARGPAVTLSDDKTKLAAAWDQGHAAAVADIQKLGGMSGADLKRHQQPVAQAVRGLKADAWDEGHRQQVGTLGKEMPQAEMADAARSMRATPYAYKPEYAGEEGQAPGEVNVGPVAQEMQKSPVAATAVKQDSPNGIRAIDIPKFTKVLGGVAASQQEQLDEQQRQISLMAQRLRSKR